MTDAPTAPAPAPAGRLSFLAILFVIVSVYGCSIYANLAFAVTNPADYRYFPPFERGVNDNDNKHLGAEYFKIAQSLLAGEGFSAPFGEHTGPTAWMPPILPGLLAGLLWLCDNDKDAVMAVVIFLQVSVLIGTGVLVLAVTRQTCRRAGAWLAALLFLGTLLCHFRLCFQFTHDCWLILLAVDLLIAGLIWLRPLQRWWTAAGWGLFGGLCALINPMVALAWGMFSLVVGVRSQAWSRLAITLMAAGLALAPWTVRNYRVFGRFIPTKSNVNYELYQSQCLQKDGLIREGTFGTHPYASAGPERQEYKRMGEIAFLDKKGDLFRQAVRNDPLDFLDRVASRFLAATLWYEPFHKYEATKRPWSFWLSRLTHPLPFLGLLILLFTAPWQRLDWAHLTVIGVYLLYLLPYIAVSYYERYSVPLLGAKVLLVIWGADRLLCLLPWRRTATVEADVSPAPARKGKRSGAIPLSS